jgi:predicted CXXCH cytochrome family protein
VAAGNNNLVVKFTPDVEGTYVVQMVVNADSLSSGTAAGSATASVTITASTYVGVGLYRLATKDYLNGGNCVPCHTSTVNKFVKTNHASAFARKVSQVGGHFADYCMHCHTANTFATGANNGYDAYATALGFTIPHNGMTEDGSMTIYDSLVTKAVTNSALGNDSLLTMLTMTSIQCESCHGPASEHKANSGNPAYMDARQSSEVCAPCHFSSDRHPKGYSWENSRHAVSVDDNDKTYLNHMNRSSCGRCHVGQGFLEFVKTGDVVTEFWENPEPIGCATCHDPHDQSGKEYQLYRGTVAEACTGCHTTRMSSRGLHHSHQGQMIQGKESAPTTLAVLDVGGVVDVSGFELVGYNYENSAHSDIEDLCVACHMAPSPDFDPTFASPDTLLNKLGGHSWSVKWDAGTPLDATDDIINDTGCKTCHSTGLIPPVTLAYVEAAQHEIKALLDTLKAYLPPISGTNPEPKVYADQTTPVNKAASYNYYFVAYDGSYGAHNFKYAKTLLESSIEQVKLGAGAAAITSIMDVPNDQGGNVQVVWNRFPAEDFSFNPVVNYGVWRQDPVIGTKVTPKKNYTDMIKTGVPGQQYSVTGVVWTYVALVPATDLPMYSYIAPTLKNGTATDTTLFYIAGYSSDNMHVYSSQPFGGFSVDNLPPLRVVDFAVNPGTGNVTLTWKPNPEDTDVAKFLVYRGTTANFTPGTPLAEVTARTYVDAGVTSGTAYWYIVRAVDHSGNQGELSSSMGTTNVEQTEGLPTTYALGQNFPNPFNPSTTINFSLPEAGTVVLSVYTISGELVKTLAQGEFPAGNFKATWTGTDENGAQVATGMYLYRIQSGTFTSVKKMIMLK